MRRAEEASGRFKALLVLAFLAAIIFVAVKTIPPYVNNFELQDHIQELSSWQLEPGSPRRMRYGVEVVAFAQDHGVPLTADDVQVTIGRRVSINVDYTVPVDLMVYTLKLHFTPSAENLSL